MCTTTQSHTTTVRSKPLSNNAPTCSAKRRQVAQSHHISAPITSEQHNSSYLVFTKLASGLASAVSPSPRIAGCSSSFFFFHFAAFYPPLVASCCFAKLSSSKYTTSPAIASKLILSTNLEKEPPSLRNPLR